MNAVHARDLHRIAQRFDRRPKLLDEASTLKVRLAGAARVVEIPDRGLAGRQQWLDRCIPFEQTFRFRAGEFRYLAQAEQTFELLLLSGDDRAKLLPILRTVRDVFASKIVVPFMSHCSAEDRALLLRRGADDVLHLGVSPEEGAARMAALVRRQTWAANRQVEADRTISRAAAATAELRWLCAGPIAPQGQQVLAALFGNMGRVVPHMALTSAARTSDHWPSERQLHVIICGIRKHLRPQFVIDTLRGEGFRLRRGTKTGKIDAVSPRPARQAVAAVAAGARPAEAERPERGTVAVAHRRRRGEGQVRG